MLTRHYFVLLQVVERPVFHEHVGLVNEQHGVPARASAQCLLEVDLDLECRAPEITDAKSVQRPFQVFGDYVNQRSEMVILVPGRLYLIRQSLSSRLLVDHIVA